MESVRRMLQRLMGEDIELTTQLDRGLGAIRFDPAQLDQLLLNLAVHAREAMPVGGTLVIGTQRVAVNERRSSTSEPCPGLYAQLSVRTVGTAFLKMCACICSSPSIATATAAERSDSGSPACMASCGKLGAPSGSIAPRPGDDVSHLLADAAGSDPSHAERARRPAAGQRDALDCRRMPGSGS